MSTIAQTVPAAFNKLKPPQLSSSIVGKELSVERMSQMAQMDYELPTFGLYNNKHIN
jgi:hypothetical protein